MMEYSFHTFGRMSSANALANDFGARGWVLHSLTVAWDTNTNSAVYVIVMQRTAPTP